MFARRPALFAFARRPACRAVTRAPVAILALAVMVAGWKGRPALAQEKTAPEKPKAAPAKSIARLQAELDDKTPAVRLSAVAGLCEAGAKARPAVGRLLEILKDPKENAVMRGDIAQALGEIAPAGKDVVAVLVETLKDRDRDTRLNAAQSLTKSGVVIKSFSKEVAPFLHDAEPFMRIRIAQSCARHAIETAVAVKVLREGLTHYEPNVRISAGRALMEIGTAVRPAVPELTKALEDEDVNVRINAAAALVKAGAAAKPAVPALIKALESDNFYLRVNAAGALWAIGPGAAAAVPALKYAAENDIDARVRSTAATALKSIGGR